MQDNSLSCKELFLFKHLDESFICETSFALISGLLFIISRLISGSENDFFIGMKFSQL